ncbi:MAG TPA: sigma-70 family RNA polymerase sigma factor [Acidobacteriaceae bacterium]
MRTVAITTAVSQAIAAEAIASNAVIARGLKKHDTQMLDLLIEQYQHRLLRYLLFLTGKRDLAEDLFQETWMRVLTRGTQYDGRARFDTWLFTIARNLVIDNSRKRRVASLDEMAENAEDAQPFEIASDEPSPLDYLRLGEQNALLAEVLLQLDANYREVLTLRFHEELSLEEIATVTRAPLSTVKSRLYRGLAALRPHLERLQYGHTGEEAS